MAKKKRGKGKMPTRGGAMMTIAISRPGTRKSKKNFARPGSR